MRKYNHFDRGNIEDFGNDISSFMQKHKEELDAMGVTFKVGTSRYSEINSNLSINFIIKDGNKGANQILFDAVIKSTFMLNVSDFGMSFRDGGRTYTISSGRFNSKYSIGAIRDDGKEYFFEIRYVAGCLGKFDKS